MSDLLTKERNTTYNAKLKKDISELTNLIKSINLQKDNDKKSNIKKKKKLISPNCFNFMSSKYLMKYSSLDTPEKQKKSSRKKNKKIKNKAKSERVVTNFFSEKKTKEKEEEEDCIEEEKIKSLKANIILYFLK
jgi:hypothetical protein